MNLVIKELNFKKSQRFIEAEFGSELLFTELFFSRKLLEAGDFFTVVPEDVKLENLYEFKAGEGSILFFGLTTSK